MVTSFCLKEKQIIHTKDIIVRCVSAVLTKLRGGGRLKTRKHGIEWGDDVEGAIGEIVLLVLDALLIGKNERVIAQKKLGSCHGNMVTNIRTKRT